MLDVKRVEEKRVALPLEGLESVPISHVSGQSKFLT